MPVVPSELELTGGQGKAAADLGERRLLRGRGAHVLVGEQLAEERRPGAGSLGGRRRLRQRQCDPRRRAVGCARDRCRLRAGPAGGRADPRRGRRTRCRVRARATRRTCRYETDSVDAVLSVFGAMFAPDHLPDGRGDRTGGPARAEPWPWPPGRRTGSSARCSAWISGTLPGPPGVQSPLLGDEDHLIELFGGGRAVCAVGWSGRAPGGSRAGRGVRDVLPPVVRADAQGVRVARRCRPVQLWRRDLTELARRFDRHKDGRGVAIPATYLESVLVLR